MTAQFRAHLDRTLAEIESAGLMKRERVLTTPQGSLVGVGPSISPAGHAIAGRSDVLNFCANNYLGLADHPAVIAPLSSASAKVKILNIEPGSRAA